MLTADEARALDRPSGEAIGLPARAYTCEDFARAERERLFARTWMCAGYAHEVPSPGDVAVREVAGAPLLFARNREGRIRCFHNVCTHRGSLLVPAAASGRQALRCRYHGWTFDLDGRLVLAPHWGGKGRAADLDRSCLGLKPVRLARWHDWLFVNLDGKAEPFEDYAAPFLAQCAEYRLADATWCRTLPYEIAGNWKLVAENYLETLHLDFVHSVLAEVAPFAEHRTLADGSCLGTIIDVGLPAAWAQGEALPRWPGIGEDNRTAKNLALFPNFKFVVGPDHCCSMVEFPSGAGRSHQRWDFYFHGEGATAAAFAPAREAIVDFYDKTNREDFEAVEAVQAGHRSPAMAGARFSAIWEGGVHHFQKLVAAHMTA